MKFAFASCQQYEHGYYTAYKHMANEDLDLIIHVGDYIYEYSTNGYTAGGGGNVRGHSNHEVMSLADYRERHAQHKTDPDLQAAHAAAPWLATFDDHEVDDNWAGQAPGDGSPPKFYAARKAAAFKAYWEHMPLRSTSKPTAQGIQIFRRGGYGDLATFHVLDTRQFRSDQPCNDGIKACSDRSSDALPRSAPASRSSSKPATPACRTHYGDVRVASGYPSAKTPKRRAAKRGGARASPRPPLTCSPSGCATPASSPSPTCSFRLRARPVRVATAVNTLLISGIYPVAQLVGAGAVMQALAGISFPIAVLVCGVFRPSSTSARASCSTAPPPTTPTATRSSGPAPT